MKKFTNKRQSLERKYNQIKAEIMRDREHCCAGCGRYGIRITFSHRIPRSRNIQLLTDKENIDLMCLSCHEKVETGRYGELANGDEILAYIERVDPKYFFIKTLNQQKTHIE